MKVAGIGDGEGIGGVEIARCLLESKDRLENGGDLFLGGVAVACDVLFDDRGLVFGDGEIAADGGGDGYALGAAKFKH